MEQKEEVLNRLGFDNIEKVFDKAVEEVDKRRLGLISPYKTKWLEFNKLLGGGIQKETTYAVGGRPGIGKSAFTNTLLFDICEINDLTKTIILYWNFEMPNYKQIVRIASHEMKRTVNKIMSANSPLEEDNFLKFKQIKDKIKDYPIYFTEKSKPFSYIYNATLEVKTKFPEYHIISIIDHTRLPSKTSALESEEQRITNLLQTQRDLAVDIGQTGILLSQLNRNVESPDRAKSKYVPQLSDFFGADSIGQFANVGIILQRPELYGLQEYLGEDAKDLLAVHFVKNRDGEPNINIGLYFNGKVGTFKELPRTDDLEGMKKLYEYIKMLE